MPSARWDEWMGQHLWFPTRQICLWYELLTQRQPFHSWPVCRPNIIIIFILYYIIFIFINNCLATIWYWPINLRINNHFPAALYRLFVFLITDQYYYCSHWDAHHHITDEDLPLRRVFILIISYLPVVDRWVAFLFRNSKFRYFDSSALLLVNICICTLYDCWLRKERATFIMNL